MEDILAIVLIFGGSTAVLLAFSPIGRALADRIRHRDRLPAMPVRAVAPRAGPETSRPPMPSQLRLDCPQRSPAVPSCCR